MVRPHKGSSTLGMLTLVRLPMPAARQITASGRDIWAGRREAGRRLGARIVRISTWAVKGGGGLGWGFRVVEPPIPDSALPMTRPLEGLAPYSGVQILFVLCSQAACSYRPLEESVFCLLCADEPWT